ncbi:hypothetical protein CR492_05510 [Methylocella silvestris]|uniref:TadE-like domain-containing protein n=1 Tax=Methylocella silvestris TaxID=199596 RepID=A0A2J7TK49_METSI|nr:hypothetical protein CR492_05510 [Methylocella silvestris]
MVVLLKLIHASTSITRRGCVRALKLAPGKALRRRNEAGTAALEFGLATPLLLILIAGVTEIGLAVYQGMQVSAAVEAGMMYAAKNGWSSSGIASAVVSASGATGLTATPAPSQFCGCPAATGITATTCTSTCANGYAPGQYIQINAALAHQTILSNLGLPLPATLTATSLFRQN